jgi:hypothetical protein
MEKIQGVMKMINEHPPKMTKENEMMWKQTKLMNTYTEETKVNPVLKFNELAPKQDTYLGKIR